MVASRPQVDAAASGGPAEDGPTQAQKVARFKEDLQLVTPAELRQVARERNMPEWVLAALEKMQGAAPGADAASSSGAT